MSRPVKNGLLFGGIGLVLNICVSTAFGFCGPFVSLLAGGFAGFFTAQQQKLLSKADGARAGAISGAVAGALVFVGQTLGGIGAVALVQYTSGGGTTIFGPIPDPSAGLEAQLPFYVGALGTALCFGVIGIVLSVAAGAGAGYLGTSGNNVAAPNSAPSV